MEIIEKLARIQVDLKAPKNLYNSFGKYKYRNAEGICEAVKPYLQREGCSLILSDEIEVKGDRIYVKATATIMDGESDISVSAYAREADEKKGMDASQITGTASSYARKYALNGLFLLDDTKDADTDEYHNQTTEEKVDPLTDKDVAILSNMLGDKTFEAWICNKYKIKTLKDMTSKDRNTLIAHIDEARAKFKESNGN